MGRIYPWKIAGVKRGGRVMEDFWMEHRYSSCCYQLEPHYEHTYQLVFLLKGKILYQVGEKQYEVSKGGMILLNSLEEHTLKVLEYPYERYVIQINPLFFQKEINAPEIISIFIKRPENFSHLLALTDPIWNYVYDVIQELEREYREKRPYWEMYIGADIRRMFITIFRECEELLASVRVDASAAIAYKVLNYLDHHYPEDISVAKLAETFFLNKHYIAHVFKAETGYSPMDYVISLRMNRAKALLAGTARSISEIAVECGYTDFNHFSKLFKKYGGMSPSQFRKTSGKE